MIALCGKCRQLKEIVGVPPAAPGLCRECTDRAVAAAMSAPESKVDKLDELRAQYKEVCAEIGDVLVRQLRYNTDAQAHMNVLQKRAQELNREAAALALASQP